MATLTAIDVAVLLPPAVAQRAIALSASLPADGSQGLRLDDDHLPHITLTQQFVREEELDAAYESIGHVLAGRTAFEVRVSGAGRSGHTLWMAVEKGAGIVELHETLMEALRGLERPEGSPAAFAGGEARAGDVLWVAGFRLKSSFGSFTPHVTLGHGSTPPALEPFTFEATTIAVCHLGRFCTCRRVLRQWTLSPPARRG